LKFPQIILNKLFVALYYVKKRYLIIDTFKKWSLKLYTTISVQKHGETEKEHKYFEY